MSRGITFVCLAALSTLVGCQTSQTHEAGEHGHLEHLTRAIAVLQPTAGNTAYGAVTFEQNGPRVTVTASVGGLSPGSEHAWHIHEFGDLSSADGTATGGHYNPEGHMHALPTTAKRHAGDLGNLLADATGTARVVLTVDNITIGGAKNPVIGRAIIVHAKHDDGGQPTGNAGARIAQGVIGVSRQ